MSLFDAFLLNALRNTLEDDDDEDIVSSVSRTDRYSFHFKHSGLISLSSDKRTAERRFQLLSAGNGIVFSDQPLRDNEVFEVSVDKLVPPLFGGSDITLDIGVTSLNPSSMNLPRTMTDLATGTWMLSGDQVVRNEVIIKRRYCQDLKTLSVGDRIGVSKTENGSLHFFINGKHQGLAASRLPQEVFAVVDLYARCTKVSIVSPGGPPSVSNSLVSKVLTNKEDELRRYHQQRQWLQECRIVTFPLWFMKNIASSEIEKRELFLFVRSYAHILGHDTFTCDGCGEKFRNRELHYYCMECEDLDLCESCFKSKKCPKDHKLDHKLSKMGWYCDGNNCCRRITGTRFHCLVCEDFDLCLGCQETKNWPARHKESHSMTKSSTLVVHTSNEDELRRYHQQRQWLQECRIVTFRLWLMKNIVSSEIEKKELFLFVRSYAHIFGHDTFTCDDCGIKSPNGKLNYHCMECENLDLCESCFKSKKCPKDHKLDHKLSEMRWTCDGNNCSGYITGTRFHCLVCGDFDLCLGCQKAKNWPARHKESHSMTKSSTLVVQTETISGQFAQPNSSVSSSTKDSFCAPGEHKFTNGKCILCKRCNQCSGYGANCINASQKYRSPGGLCGCGYGDAGCQKCGICRECAEALKVQGASLNSGYQQAERPRPIPTPTTKTTPATTTCNYRKQCESFLETLKISGECQIHSSHY
ncbi:uncharacterized protein LOC124439801 isoform X1 [Xenia sp. Carnegie-2017]|uniref:uncharacterized protein LOC124439801 isoform X1 n=1 Tax=Xenia sp. Carnegie-2017 TaxID=2897299 RepID=UPI001F0394E7|nr:uncharacterized protein LOC124439801 isoform X1 [Xenia sp. Carnegie-2017]